MGKAVEGSPAVGPPLGIRTSRFTSRFFVCYRIMYPAGGHELEAGYDTQFAGTGASVFLFI